MNKRHRREASRGELDSEGQPVEAPAPPVAVSTRSLAWNEPASTPNRKAVQSNPTGRPLTGGGEEER